MEKRALKRGLCWFIVLVLPLFLILGVVPCAAEETHTLQDLIDNKTPIYIDNLEFSNFTGQGFSSDDLVGAFEQLDVEIVGAGTDYPGLKFTPKAGSTEWSQNGTGGVRYVQFSYDVKATGSPMIIGSSLFLEPVNLVAPSAARVDDLGPADAKDRYYVLQMATPGSSGDRIENTLQGEIKFLEQPTVSPNLKVALSVPGQGGQASIQSFEHRVSLVPVEGHPVANAGPDQAVLDQVSLDGSGSSPADADYQWELYQKAEDGWKLFASASGVQVEFTNLVYGIYEARLTVTKGELSAVDTALIAAAGASGGGTEPGTPETELNLWDFSLKKYTFCKWSSARLLGTFNLPDNVEFHRGDDLVGIVTIQLNRAGEPVVVMSDDIKLNVSNWRYKLEISKH